MEREVDGARPHRLVEGHRRRGGQVLPRPVPYRGVYGSYRSILLLRGLNRSLVLNIIPHSIIFYLNFLSKIFRSLWTNTYTGLLGMLDLKFIKKSGQVM